MKLWERIVFYSLIVLFVFNTLGKEGRAFEIFAIIIALAVYIYVRPIKNAVSELTYAIIDDNQRKRLKDQTELYEIVSDLYEEGKICKGMTVKEVIKIVDEKDKNHTRFSSFLAPDEIVTNPSRFKKTTETITDYVSFPRYQLKFKIVDSKIVKISNGLNYIGE